MLVGSGCQLISLSGGSFAEMDLNGFVSVHRYGPLALGGTVAAVDWGRDGHAWLMSAARCVASSVARSAFAGFRFPAEVITLAVRWYLRFGLLP